MPGRRAEAAARPGQLRRGWPGRGYCAARQRSRSETVQGAAGAAEARLTKSPPQFLPQHGSTHPPSVVCSSSQGASRSSSLINLLYFSTGCMGQLRCKQPGTAQAGSTEAPPPHVGELRVSGLRRARSGARGQEPRAQALASSAGHKRARTGQLRRARLAACGQAPASSASLKQGSQGGRQPSPSSSEPLLQTRRPGKI